MDLEDAKQLLIEQVEKSNEELYEFLTAEWSGNNGFDLEKHFKVIHTERYVDDDMAIFFILQDVDDNLFRIDSYYDSYEYPDLTYAVTDLKQVTRQQKTIEVFE